MHPDRRRAVLPIGTVIEIGDMRYVVDKSQRGANCTSCDFDTPANDCVHNGAAGMCGAGRIFKTVEADLQGAADE